MWTDCDDWVCVCVFLFPQGAQVSGDRDGDVHRHVLSLPADQDHEEHPNTDSQVSTPTMTSDLWL